MNALIHENVLRVAKIHSSKVAVREPDKQLSYAQLAEQSFVLSKFISILLGRSDSVVALYTGKNIEALVGIYSLLRSGKAYLPLDIKSPPPRLQHIIQDCGVKTFITVPHLLEDLFALLGSQAAHNNIVVLGDGPAVEHSLHQHVSYIDLRKVRAASSDDIYRCDKISNQTAAVLYTSGSTGMPKGVVITHSAITTFVLWAHYYFELKPEENCASHAPLHFDLSLFDIFASHYSATCVCLVPDTMVGNPKYLSRFIEKFRITVWQSVPSVLTMIKNYGDLEKFKVDHLRHVLFAGEKMNVRTLKNLGQHFPKAQFHNVYGSTEMNDTFVYSFPASATQYPDPLPIGKPLPYVDFKIVDSDGSYGPDITQGELYVCAPTVMPYYINTDVKTSCFRFFHNDDRRYYKTKDIVKMQGDGNLIFFARTDDIVKSAGNRVNVVEIESTIQGHHDAREVAVYAVEDEEIGSRLVAHVFTDNHKLSALQLKLHCAKHLPKYAIPHFFEIAGSPFPKTSSGKINKNHLNEMRGNNVETA